MPSSPVIDVRHEYVTQHFGEPAWEHKQTVRKYGANIGDDESDAAHRGRGVRRTDRCASRVLQQLPAPAHCTDCNRRSSSRIFSVMTPNRRPRSAPNDRELRLWKVGRALTLAFAAAVLVAGGVFYFLVVLLDVQEIGATAKLDAKTLFDLVKLSFGVVAGAGALVALVVAYRRQRVDEAGAHREATRLHTERFSQAVDKLGSDSPAVRLGGVHALAGLADDAPDNSLRQTCIDVLCAYLQLPFTPDPGTGLTPVGGAGRCRPVGAECGEGGEFLGVQRRPPTLVGGQVPTAARGQPPRQKPIRCLMVRSITNAVTSAMNCPTGPSTCRGS